MLSYFLNHLTGLWAMAFDHEGWEENMDRSIDGVFRSFFLMIPCFAIVISLSFLLTPVYRELDLGVNNEPVSLAAVPGTILIFIRFLVEWFASLGFLLLVAKKLDQASYAVDIIIGYNWLQMMTKFLLAFPVLLLTATKSIDLSGVVTLPVMVLIIALYWGVLRRSLPNLLPAVTAGTLIGLFIINILIQMVFTVLSHPFILQPVT